MNQNYQKKTIVVKYGGAAMTTPELKLCVIKDVIELKRAGAAVVLVHGGGPELSELQERLGIETRFIDGLRVTDGKTIEAALMALCGKTNKDIVRMLEHEGCKAAGISGIDGSVLKCEKQKSPDIGFVGEITGVEKGLLDMLIAGGFIPVVSTVGLGSDGCAYNINADTAAGRIAAELKADFYITLSDVPGVLEDKNDPASLIIEMDVQRAEELIEAGVIKDGMIPKVRGLIDAIGLGVGRASIIDGRVPHALLTATSGTTIVARRKDPKK